MSEEAARPWKRKDRRDADRAARQDRIERYTQIVTQCSSCGTTAVPSRYIYGPEGTTKVCAYCAVETAIG